MIHNYSFNMKILKHLPFLLYEMNVRRQFSYLFHFQNKKVWQQ
jgi:hypothetical protein